MVEKEYKWLVTFERFNQILELLRLDRIPEQIITQKNHYYIASNKIDNIGRTIRVREIDGTYTLQIKERKDVFGKYSIAEEKHRYLPYVPVQFTAQELGLEQSQPFNYVGFSTTTRHRFKLDEYNRIDCDLSQYINKIDYEIEFEFSEKPPIKYLNIFNDLRVNSISKYERFLEARSKDTCNDMEYIKKIRNVIYKVLKVPDVLIASINDPLVKYGLDSLNMIQIVVALEEEFLFEIPDYLLDFIAFETIEKILNVAKICLIIKEERCAK